MASTDASFTRTYMTAGSSEHVAHKLLQTCMGWVAHASDRDNKKDTEQPAGMWDAGACCPVALLEILWRSKH